METYAVSFIMTFIMAMIAMAFYTLMERKFLGYFQLRKGPNKVMLSGIPQPFADAIKLFTKETTKPKMINTVSFISAPSLTLMLALLLWVLYPHSNPSTFIKYGILYFLCISSMNVYSVFISGWASNSKYTLLGAMRAVAQTISYEVSMAIILLSVLMTIHTMDMSSIHMSTSMWPLMMMLPIFLMWFITNLAETNRTPFDLAEGESELVSGFNTEYSGALFALIFMAEYANILLMSLLSAVLFMTSFPLTMFPNSWLMLKTMMFATLFIWVRATLPRIRYDKLMYLTWKGFLPTSLMMMMVITQITLLIK